jgi:hypothetical protein
MQLNLSETGSDEYMGYVRISVTIIPQTAEEMDTVGDENICIFLSRKHIICIKVYQTFDSRNLERIAKETDKRFRKIYF